MLTSLLPTALTTFNDVKLYILSRKLASLLAAMGVLSVGLGSVQLFRTANQGPTEIPSSASQLPSEISWLIVDVGGAVVHPGVYQLKTGERWSQAVQQAGGILPQADPIFVAKQLNLAKPAEDGGKLYIPFSGEEALSSPPELGGVQSSSEASLNSGVSINTATAAELDALPGLGAKRVEDIIQNRPYASLDELLERKILTQSIFDDLSGLISL